MTQLSEVSQLLFLAHDGGAFTREEIAELHERIWLEVLETEAGRKLAARIGRDAAIDRIFELVSRQYANRSVYMSGAREVLEQAARDLLVDLPLETPTVAPKPKVAPTLVLTAEEEAKINEQQEEEKKHEGKVRQFAYMVRQQLNRTYDPRNNLTLPGGAASLKPRAGIVTIYTNDGHIYEYPNDQFESLWSDAVRLGVLTSGGLQ